MKKLLDTRGQCNMAREFPWGGGVDVVCSEESGVGTSHRGGTVAWVKSWYDGSSSITPMVTFQAAGNHCHVTGTGTAWCVCENNFPKVVT